MNIDCRSIFRAALVIVLMLIIVAASRSLRADTGTCGGASITLPFTDVPSTSTFFCSIAEAFFSGLTNGTTATTYSPSDPVPRAQGAAFVSRTMDQSLKRGSRRAALKQFWTPTSVDGLGFTAVGSTAAQVESDGADLWVSNPVDSTVLRVRASDGRLLETWTGATSAAGVLAARGLIFVTGNTGNIGPGTLYQIDPTQPAGAVTTVTTALGLAPFGIAFDGARIWTANFLGGSVSIVTLNPLSLTTVTGFMHPTGLLYDGANMWVTDFPGKLFKLDSTGAIVQTVTVAGFEDGLFPVFDGTNIWVPSSGLPSTVTVVRASTGAILATLSGNGLNDPHSAAFDGERILVTNNIGNSVSLWKAADLSPLGSVSMGENSIPGGACSDGLNFWVALYGAGKLVRF